jgi:sn-glycerol 3-phosphate transport system ATP-binding protein
MADQVVLLNKGRIEQVGAPRELYARPATAFAARFIGTPPMNLVSLQGDRIAGSDVAAGLSAALLGVRPESIRVQHEGVPATVQGVEYLGADLVLRCGVGTQTLLVRAAGQHQAKAGDAVRLHWHAHDAHGFDAAGIRVH